MAPPVFCAVRQSGSCYVVRPGVTGLSPRGKPVREPPREIMSRRCSVRRALRRCPADDVHVGVDVAVCLGAEVHMIGMLVHIEHHTGWPPASVVVWSAAQALTRRLSRGE